MLGACKHGGAPATYCVSTNEPFSGLTWLDTATTLANAAGGGTRTSNADGAFTDTSTAGGAQTVTMGAENPAYRALQTLVSLRDRDTTAPNAVAYVNDGLSNDVEFANLATTFPMSWAGVTDRSGVSYEYCVSSTTACGGTPILTWTSAAGATSVTAAGLSVTNGTTYYGCVRVRDGVNLASGMTCSNGVTINSIAPLTPTLVSPAASIGIASWPPLVATYNDPAPSTDGSIEFQVCTDSTCTTVVETGSSASGVVSGLDGSWTPTSADGDYWWRARARDGAGTASGWTVRRAITIGSASLSIAVDSSTRALGLLVPTLNATGTTVVTVSTNAANGYQLFAADGSNVWGIESLPSDSIPDWTGTVTTPTVWTSGTTGYFGVSVINATGGRLAKWGPGTGWPATDFANNLYSGLSTSSQLIHQRSTFSLANDSISVTYRVNVDTLQPPGSYSGIVSYSMVGQP